MTSTPKPAPGCANSSPGDTSPPAPWTTAASPTSTPGNSANSPKSTFSLESEAGPSPCAGRAGPTTAPSGPAHVPVSRFRARDSEKAMPTNDTCGPLFTLSSPSASLQLSLESRLRARMGANGSPEFALTWKELDMPSGPPICALRASERRTAGKGCSGLVHWSTPTVQDSANNAGPSQFERNTHPLNVQAALSGWPTPQEDNANNAYGHAGTQFSNLPTTAQLAGWATPNTMDSLPIRSDEALARSKAKAGCANLKDQIPVGPVGGGLKPSIAGTEKRAALNPAHSRWLMGYPAAWDSCGATAMQLSRKSPPNSSTPSKKQSFD